MLGRNLYAWEWRPELKLSEATFTWEDLEANFVKFIPSLQKLSFKPTRLVLYRCMYKSDVPSRKFVLHRQTKTGYDKIVFFSCIHNYEMNIQIDGELFRSGPLPVAYHTMEQMFEDFILEKYRWFLNSGSTSVFKKKVNKAKIKYNPYQTKNLNLLALEFKPKKANQQLALSILLLNKKQKTKPIILK